MQLNPHRGSGLESDSIGIGSGLSIEIRLPLVLAVVSVSVSRVGFTIVLEFSAFCGMSISRVLFNLLTLAFSVLQMCHSAVHNLAVCRRRDRSFSC